MVSNQETVKRKRDEEGSSARSHSHRGSHHSKVNRATHSDKQRVSSGSERHTNQIDQSRQEPHVRTEHRSHQPHDSKQPHVKPREADRASKSMEHHDERRHQHERHQLPAGTVEKESGHEATASHRHQQNRNGLKATAAKRQVPPAAQLGTGKSAKPAVPKALLSFGEEMDIDADGSLLSLADSTQRKFKSERRIEDGRPILAPSQTAVAIRGGQASPLGQSSAQKNSLGQMWFGVAAVRGMRDYMEDTQTVVTSFTPLGRWGAPCPDGVNRSFAAVYDGHNGAKAAEECKSRLHMILASQAALRDCTGDAPATDQAEKSRMVEALRSSFHTMDQEILQRARQEDGRDGSTAVVILRTGGVLYAAHCGDSRAVLCRQGKAVRLTEDHKPNLLPERQRIQAVGGRVEFNRCWRVIVEPQEQRSGSGLAVSRSFGDLDFKEPNRFVECEPEVRHVRLTDQDSFLVLASDGLWDVMTDAEAVQSVQESLQQSTGSWAQKSYSDMHAKSAADTLTVKALQKGTMDNVSAIVCLLSWN